MPLTPGDKNASSGMSKEIFEMIKTNMNPIVGGSPPSQTEDVWKALANAIAVGVTAQLAKDFKTITTPPGPDGHIHTLST